MQLEFNCIDLKLRAIIWILSNHLADKSLASAENANITVGKAHNEIISQSKITFQKIISARVGRQMNNRLPPVLGP